MKRWFVLGLSLAACACSVAPVAAQSSAVAGVWRAREGTPSGMAAGISSSDVQTMVLTPDGRYRREIRVEGGDGTTGAAGTIVDRGTYRFTAPATFYYSRQSWTVCVAGGCIPRQGPPPNAGTLPFHVDGSHAQFIGLRWTKVR